MESINRNHFQKPADDDDGEMYLNSDDRFKEFTVYVRNGSAKSLGKWVKL
jgi:hypothetical protein